MALAHKDSRTGTLTVDTPTHVAGDLIRVWVRVSGASAPTISAPDGSWTQIGSTISQGTMSIAGFWKVATGSEPSSYTFTSSGSSQPGSVASSYEGADTTTPSNGTPTSGTGNSAAPSAASITTTEDGAILDWFCGVAANPTITVPSGMTNRGPANRATSGDKVQAAAGASGAQTGSLSASGNWAALMWAIKPAAGLPTVAITTPDETVFTTATPQLTAIGSGAGPLRYRVQIGTTPDFAGELVEDSNRAGSGGSWHPQPHASATAWNGQIQVDDRICQSITVARRCRPVKVVTPLGDFTADVDGDALERIYRHQGTYGTSSEPENAAEPADTPTPDWIVESDPVPLLGAESNGDRDFPFSDLAILDPGNYVLASDWSPADRVENNRMAWSGAVLNSGADHDGNVYNDGHSAANNGIQATWDRHFDFHTTDIAIDADSSGAGWQNLDDAGDTDPFTSDDEVGYTPPSLPDGQYYLRMAAKEPGGADQYGPWATVIAFTIDTSGGSPTPVSASDSVGAAATETASVLSTPAAVDQPELLATASQALETTLARPDISTAAATETGAVAVVLVAVDAIGAQLTDVMADLRATFLRTDAAALSVEDVTAIVASVLARTDAVAAAAGDVAALLVSIGRTDATALASTEASSVENPGNIVSASDALAVAAADAPSPIVGELLRQDSSAMAAAELADILTTIVRGEAASLQVTDAAAVLLAFNALEALGCELTEIAVTTVLVHRPDVMSAAIQDLPAPLETWVATADAMAATAAHSPDLVELLAAVDLVTARVSEAGNLTLAFYGTDAGAVQTLAAAAVGSDLVPAILRLVSATVSQSGISGVAIATSRIIDALQEPS
jgi:hypothetical protein